ncbi:lys-63-specific deubiquitinase BRCC36-like [Anneissia japonica]|uniref:lys-63-specific deubiquitinase BRCC36-like n=1 Tax=Anneissia japonica TaxID=1529436 RepID=UPI001425568B|nr:lys-63-specific deubiquitinase BRCC36-like [Anneissia japonica]
MTISCVHLKADAYMVCLTHALSTEREEVMGLCIGEILRMRRMHLFLNTSSSGSGFPALRSVKRRILGFADPGVYLFVAVAICHLTAQVDTNRVVHIVSVIMLRRSDKRKDRVEISPEQLTHAASEAEISFYSDQVSRVKNYEKPYVQTQAMYQMMDEGFVGLIFSCFHDDKTTNQGHVTVTCFQSTNQSPEGEPPMYERLEIPFHIVKNDTLSEPCLQAMIQLPRILHEEEEDAYNQAQLPESNDLITDIHNSAGK